MKIIVDELPENSHECLFSRYFTDLFTRQLNSCILSKEPFFECKMGNEGFKCPHLRCFQASVRERIPGHDNTFKVMPVQLEEE